MVRFDIVGINDCPWFAKAVKLADEIAGANSRVEFYHEMLDKLQFKDYCDKMKQLRGWDIKKSPVVSEVLVDPSGKALLIGDISDFCDFAAMYFDIYYDPSSSAMQEMAIANRHRFAQPIGNDHEEKTICNIGIVNAPLRMLELLVTSLISPISMIPPGILLDIRIYDTFTDIRNLNGLLMEATDMVSPNLFKIQLTSSLASCFNHCDLLILAEDLSRGETEEREDWIARVEQNTAEVIGVLIDKKTRMTDARIIVGGHGPQCYIAEMIRGAVPPAKAGLGRVVASGQYIAQKAKAELAKLGDIPGGCIARIHAWGWPGEIGAWIEVTDAVLKGADIAVRGPGVEIPLAEEATNSDFIFTKFSKEFLRLQKKDLSRALPRACHYGQNMVMAESILATIHIWLASERLSFAPRRSSSPIQTPKSRPPSAQSTTVTGPTTTTDKDLNCGGINPNQWCPTAPYGLAPILNVGLPPPPDSTFPKGTFMVQPAICVNGRWQPVGLISEKTHERVVKEVNRLWMEREEFVYRDKDAAQGLFPDWEVMNRTRDGYVRRAKPGQNYPEFNGEGGAGQEFYGEGGAGYSGYYSNPPLFFPENAQIPEQGQFDNFGGDYQYQYDQSWQQYPDQGQGQQQDQWGQQQGQWGQQQGQYGQQGQQQDQFGQQGQQQGQFDQQGQQQGQFGQQGQQQGQYGQQGQNNQPPGQEMANNSDQSNKPKFFDEQVDRINKI